MSHPVISTKGDDKAGQGKQKQNKSDPCSLKIPYNEDPENNNPAKLFSSVAWIQENVPDFEARANRAVEEYRQELESYDANQPQ